MNKRYTPTCFFAHIGVYQHRSPSVPETGKRQRGYVYPQRIGCGEHRFNRGFAPLEQSIGKPGIDTGLGGKVVGVPGTVRGLFTERRLRYPIRCGRKESGVHAALGNG